MTISQIIAFAIAWTAVAVAVWALISLRSTARHLRGERRTFPWRGAEITVTAPMSDADYEAFKARWAGTGVGADGTCTTYRPPADPADSGLCAGCGMYDYKHQETPDA